DDLLRDDDAAEGDVEAEPPLSAQGLLDRRRRLLLRLRVPVAAERLDERAPGAEVELADEVALAEVEVDGALVDGRVGALALDEAEHGSGADVDHGEGLRARRAERHPRRRVVPARPDVAGRRTLELRERRGALERRGTEDRPAAVVERRL